MHLCNKMLDASSVIVVYCIRGISIVCVFRSLVLRSWFYSAKVVKLHSPKRQIDLHS